jgi:phosphatidylinositol-3-phosphatase
VAKASTRGWDRVFVIVLENHSQHAVIGDLNTPFITALAQQYGQAADYFGVTHPSEPNYIAMISGSNWFTNNDNPANRFDHTNLIDELDARHISWGANMEALPAADPLTDFWPSAADPLYASKHDLFALFTDIRGNPARVAHIKAYTDLAADPSSPARRGSCSSPRPVQRHARRRKRRDRRASRDTVPVQQHQR